MFCLNICRHVNTPTVQCVDVQPHYKAWQVQAVVHPVLPYKNTGTLLANQNSTTKLFLDFQFLFKFAFYHHTWRRGKKQKHMSTRMSAVEQFREKVKNKIAFWHQWLKFWLKRLECVFFFLNLKIANKCPTYQLSLNCLATSCVTASTISSSSWTGNASLDSSGH